MLSIPPHTSHQLQTLVPTFYAFIKTGRDLCLNIHGYDRISHFEVVELFNIPYLKRVKTQKPTSGFTVAGI
jgi:hypothetical protein